MIKKIIRIIGIIIILTALILVIVYFSLKKDKIKISNNEEILCVKQTFDCSSQQESLDIILYISRPIDYQKISNFRFFDNSKKIIDLGKPTSVECMENEVYFKDNMFRECVFKFEPLIEINERNCIVLFYYKEHEYRINIGNINYYKLDITLPTMDLDISGHSYELEGMLQTVCLGIDMHSINNVVEIKSKNELLFIDINTSFDEYQSLYVINSEKFNKLIPYYNQSIGYNSNLLNTSGTHINGIFPIYYKYESYPFSKIHFFYRTTTSNDMLAFSLVYKSISNTLNNNKSYISYAARCAS